MTRKTIFLSLIFGVIGILIGWCVASFWNSETPRSDQKFTEWRSGGFQFINPLLECQTDDGGAQKELAIFKQTIQDEIEHHKNEDVWYISVYFRDLNNGPWFGVNEQEKFIPASLLKVPVMLAAFKEDEKDPGFFETKVRYVADSGADNQNIRTGEALRSGENYTTRELMEYMIQNSDNQALTALSGALPEGSFEKVMEDFGIPIPTSTTVDFLGVHRYAGFFRILFNASYLSRTSSEEALKILSKSQYKDGIVAGLPSGMTVAHKFGERTIMIGDKLAGRQLHDCGIVYYPNRPYLLCIMTRGSEYIKLSAVIRDLSEAVYKEINTQLKGGS